MELCLKRLGNYIKEVDDRNKDGAVLELLGVSITKEFIPSVANTVGTDLAKYKIIRKGQFACSLMQVSRDGGVAISLYKSDTPAIMSPAYFIFEVNNSELIAEYLELVFESAEFDREAVFYAIGGVRGTLSWEDFCDIEVDIPSIAEQDKTVRQYEAIADRIRVLEKINEKLKMLMTTIYNLKKDGMKLELIALNDILEFHDAKRRPLSAEERSLMKRNYPYYGAASIVDYVEDYLFEGTYILVSEDGANIIDEWGHPLLQVTYGQFWVNNHAHIVKGVNGFNEASIYVLLSQLNLQSIVTGAAQPKISQVSLKHFKVQIPSKEIIAKINRELEPILNSIIANLKEIDALHLLQNSYLNYL